MAFPFSDFLPISKWEGICLEVSENAVFREDA
jgi:hypothetical protein